jgi:hypothetical protein
MMSKLEKVLDDCLTRLMNGEATLEDCLAKYPEHAAELSRLIMAAGKLGPGRDIRTSPQFRNQARAQLMSHMRAHPRRPQAKWQRSLSLFQFGFLFRRAFNVALGLAAIMMLFLTTGTVLAQTALPGDTLYGWKITSEQVLRKVHPDPLTVDLMIARRRADDLLRVMNGNDQAKALALAEYQESLAQLATYNDPAAQEAISELLLEQKTNWDGRQVVVPELDKMLETMIDDESESLPADEVQEAALELDYKVVAVEDRRITYALTITNSGPASPVDATFISSLSPIEQLVSSVDDTNCQMVDGSLTCLVSDLSPEKAYQQTFTTEIVEPCYSGSVTNTVRVVSTDNITINPDPRLVAKSDINLPLSDTARVIYVQSDPQTHSLGMLTGTANMISDNLHIRAAAPAWSPNGKSLAFFGVQGISELGGIYGQGNGVWVVDIVGTQAINPRQLMAQDHIKSLAWSPNGKWLAVEVGIPNLTHEIVIIDTQDGEQESRFPGEQPAWNPDSQNLIIKSCSTSCGLWQVDIDGHIGRQITFDSTDSYPAWSPDGQYLAFSSQQRHGNWEIYVLKLADQQISRLTNRVETDTTPAFGPCGQEIYLRTDYHGSWWITAITLDGEDEYTIKQGVGPTDDWGLARPAVH